MSLADAIREVDERQQAGTCGPLNLTDHELPLRALGEFLDEREQEELAIRQRREREALEAKHQRQREKAKPAA